MAARVCRFGCRMRAACCVADARHAPASVTRQDADSRTPHPPRHASTRGQHSQQAQHAGCMSSRLAPGCIQPQQRPPAAPSPHAAAARRPHARQILAGGAKRPPETPRPRSGRQPAQHRPCEATPAAPPATRARSDLAQARQGADAGGRGLRAWRRAPGGAPPACGGWPSPSRIGRPRVGARGRRAGLAFGRAPPKSGGALRMPGRCQITEAPGRRPGPAGALPLDPRQGLAPGPNRGRADRRALGQMRLATQAGGGPE